MNTDIPKKSHNGGNASICVIGSINTDMMIKTSKLPLPGETLLGGDFLMTPGGKGANQAVAAARLGGDVMLVASVGNDLFAEHCISSFLQEQINCDFVTRSTKSSGVALINIGECGENQIVVAPGANLDLSIDQVDKVLNHIPDDSIILVQLEIPLPTVAHLINRATAKNLSVILDPAPAPSGGLPATILQGAFLVTPNETEAKILTGITVTDEKTARQAAEKLLDAGAQNIVITLGAKGAFLANSSERCLIKASVIDAIDTTAAGDCFNGALAVGLSFGMTLEESVRKACRSAAISVTRRGAQSAMPYLHELQQQSENASCLS